MTTKGIEKPFVPPEMLPPLDTAVVAAWRYRMNTDCGEFRDVLRTERDPDAFGKPGVDYSPEYTVTETPLYELHTAENEQQRQACEDEDNRVEAIIYEADDGGDFNPEQRRALKRMFLALLS